ncbi:MAG: type II toxin-antitoxin system HicA family toxin [Chloroflexota bacterium]|nr:type II toxin-antitoxin system HicA family toxin [Chloroflexota bacterium]
MIRALERAGWYEWTSRGGHRQFKHTAKPGKVTVPMHGNRPLRRHILASVLRQAGLSEEEFFRLL